MAKKKTVVKKVASHKFTESKVNSYTPSTPISIPYAVTKVVQYCATQDGVQACGSTEKKALALLKKTLAERAAKG